MKGRTTNNMVHYFKLAGGRFVLDEASGYAAAVDEITYKMLAYLTLPLPEDCPSAIRYDMAKYDSRLVDETYAAILEKHKAGLLYTDVPFDAEKAPSLCAVTSVSPAETLDGITCPVLLGDTNNTENARLLCKAAKEKGLTLTVILTQDGDFPCDRLIVPAEKYAQYRTAAPQVGVRFSYDVKKPDILSKLIEYADDGITLIDAYPENPREREEGAQTALLKEFGRAAKELFLRKKEGRPVEFLPIAMQGKDAKHGVGAHRNERCLTCSHRTVCGGRRLSFADCEVKKTLADCAVMLELS